MKRTYPIGESFRVLPRHGEPTSILEWVTQKGVKALARFPIYVVVVGFLTAIAWVWVVPFVKGCDL